MILPSGAALRSSSCAPRAFEYHAMAAATPLTTSCGVMVWKSSGTGLSTGGSRLRLPASARQARCGCREQLALLRGVHQRGQPLRFTPGGGEALRGEPVVAAAIVDRKSTRLNSSHS